MKLRVGDEILVAVGKDKGRQGKVEKVFPKENLVLIPNVNVYKRHQKGMPGTGRQGGIIEFSRPLPVGNVRLVCPNCGKKTRIGFQILKDGEKVRICKKCGRQIDKKIKNQI